MYTTAISGAAISTERATSFSGFLHSSEKIAAPSKPLSAEMAIFVKTFSVTIETAGNAKENEARADGSPIHQARISSETKARNVTTVSSAPPLLHHFAVCSPRTFSRNATRQAIAVSASAKGRLVDIHDAPGPSACASPSAKKDPATAKVNSEYTVKFHPAMYPANGETPTFTH